MAERLPGLLLLACFVLLPFGRLVELPMGLAALAGLFALTRGSRPWRQPEGRLAAVLFLGYWLPELLSAVDAIDPRRSWGEVALDLRYLPMLWFFVGGLREDRVVRRLHGGIAVVLAVWLLDALLQAATGFSLGGGGEADRLSGIFGADHLKLGAMVAVLSPFLLCVGRWPWWPWLVVPALLIVTLLAGTRAAWLMLGVVGVVLALGRLGLRRGLITLAATALVGLVLAVLAYTTSPAFQARIDRSAAILQGDRAGLDHALAFRLPIWETSLAMTAAHPLNGVGVRGFRVAYAEFAADDDPWRNFQGDQGAAHAHNLVLELLSETGLLGLLCWLLAFAMAVRAWRAADAARRHAALPASAALLAMLFPLNTHYAIYSSVWGGLLLLLLALWIAALSARPPASA